MHQAGICTLLGLLCRMIIAGPLGEQTMACHLALWPQGHAWVQGTKQNQPGIGPSVASAQMAYLAYASCICHPPAYAAYARLVCKIVTLMHFENSASSCLVSGQCASRHSLAVPAPPCSKPFALTNKANSTNCCAAAAADVCTASHCLATMHRVWDGLAQDRKSLAWTMYS